MGLDLYCYSDSKRTELHCNYTYIHVVRNILTQMTIEYLKSIKFREHFEPDVDLKNYFIQSPHEHSQKKDIEYDEQEEDFENRKNKLIGFLESSLSNRVIPINYSVWLNKKPFDINCYMNEFGIIGLLHFVDHSDSDGYLSFGECVNIMNLFSRIFVFKDKFISKDNQCQDIFFDELVHLFKTSVDNKTYIVFG